MENSSKDNYQACIDISDSSDCETVLANNTFYNNDGVLRLYFQLEPVYMFNNFAYSNRACVLSELSIAEADRQAVVARNNILYGAERAVNENMDDPDFNANAASANNTLGLCKDATMTALGVSTTLGTRDEGFVPFLPILRENSPLVDAGIDNSSEWSDGVNYIRIFKTVIPVAITAAESSAAGQSIYEYDKNGTVAKAYAEFTREVIQCGEKQRNKHESSLSR